MKVTIIGGGAFGTALANQLAQNSKSEIVLLLRNEKTRDEINSQNINSLYFYKRVLSTNIKATTSFNVLNDTDVLFIAIPTKEIPNVLQNLKSHLSENCLIVNMSKGLLPNGNTIVEIIKSYLEYANVITMKGASFSTEMMNSMPTLFTLGFERRKQLDVMLKVLEGTNIFLDYTNDIRGVELLSALKNIYAIALGNMDAQFNSLNTRFLILTKVIEEIKTIMRSMGGLDETIFLSCGIGDIALTGLSDLSRNRTLGLLIGKGFYNQSLSYNSVVLEGINTLNIVDKFLSADIKSKLPLFNYVQTLLVEPSRDSNKLDFQKVFKRNYKTVITYGTFDLLHFGHLELLRRVRNLGDKIIVGLSTDDFNIIKEKECVMSYEKRKHLLEVLRYVDLVIPEESWDQKIDDIKNYDVDLFVMGDDWKGKFDFLKEHCEVLYLPRTEGISTTKLKSLLNE
ncbi:glycerol-3-phosphate cytidylyltransferase [Aequorivita sp. KMM 9714]|uniref:glycerol-3-phosphate cytidylyltransferase n=1 Tax=Aequorivita sp. KMM 9714 TaxID=2707173 RepID=UPI0013EA3BDD|nr:glycerol-3-phosphate cytidylyltransferase [Aequorivita sp. KMM 9714]